MLPDLEAGRAEVDGELTVRGVVVVKVEGDGGGDVFEEAGERKEEKSDEVKSERE